MENLLDLLFTEQDNGLLEINKEAKLLDSVKKIITRDKGRPSDGHKEIAFKEIAYIYFSCKKQFFEGYPADQREEIIRDRAGLTGLKKWKPDELVLKAIQDFKEDVISTEDRLLISARQNLLDFLTLFEEIREYSRGLIEILKSDVNLTDADKLAKADDRKKAIDQAKEYFKESMNTVGDLKKMFTLVDELEIARKVVKKKEGRKTFSKFETDRSIYSDD